jgi:hypothetical protein
MGFTRPIRQFVPASPISPRSKNPNPSRASPLSRLRVPRSIRASTNTPSANWVVCPYSLLSSTAKGLPAGSKGDAVIYTDYVKAPRIIRKFSLRQDFTLKQVFTLKYVNSL